jgi:predicted GH43/DUF377 family glycosyl hydrolase
MYSTYSFTHETKDVFNKDEFIVKGVYALEYEDNRDFYFRWTEFYFSIKPTSKATTNVVLNIYNIFSSKRIIITTSNYKKEFNLLYGEYTFYIPLCQNDQVDIFVSPTYVEKDIRVNLGICVKKIFISDLEYKYPKRLVDIEDISNKVEFFNINEGADIHKRIKVPFEKQNGKLTILPIKTEGREFYFNPTIFTVNEQDYIIARRTKVFGENVFNTDLKMFKYPSLEPVELPVTNEGPNEQHEDPRAIVYKDKVIISTVSYFSYKNDFFHEKLLVYDKNFNYEKSIHPAYGKNGSSVTQNTGDEKNWTFFEYNGKLMFVHQMNPHTVVETDLEGKIITEYKTHFNVKSKWKFGEPRLSTNPIYKDGYYHSFFHSHLPLREDKFLTKMYFMGYYKFRAEPPFDIIEVMEEPILWGNNILPRREPLVPYCVFPCGFILKDDTFIISLGVNDEDCAILEYKLPT